MAPTPVRPGDTIPAYSAEGQVVKPLWPPSDSSWLLVPEASGAWCYYDSACGSASWFAPDASTAPQSRTLVTPPEAFAVPSPWLDPQVRLATIERHGWMVIFHDADHEVLLRHKLTGAVRDAPWVSLRTDEGRIFFANLVTRETRWFPPHRWMEGWISREQHILPGLPTSSVLYTSFDERGMYGRNLLPQELSRFRVDGGAPYLHSYGCPQYPSDKSDSPLTYPMV